MSDGATPARRSAAPLWPTAVWLVVTATILAARPPMVDLELPVHAAAWWAWTGHGTVPYLAELSSDTPPLLFWCIRIGWEVLGAGEIWARLVASLFGLAALWLIVPVARLLWPADGDAARFAPIILGGSGGFVSFLALTEFAWPLLFFDLLSFYAVLLAARRRSSIGWTLYAAALALGEVSAGAVSLWHMLPVALALPLAQAELRGRALARWWLRGAVATMAGVAAAALCLAWTVGAPLSGDHGGLVERLLLQGPPGSVDSDRPWYWYILIAWLLLYPWLWWPPLWRSFGRARHRAGAAALAPCWLAALIIIVVTLIGGRQTSDLLPALPPLALIAGRLWSSHTSKAKDFHAAVPGLLALFVCLFFFMLNIVPVAQLDAVWRRLFAADLPIWLGGLSLASGITLLTGSYLLALLAPRGAVARLNQLALLPVLLALTVSLEFAISLRPFFDVTPIAQHIRALQDAGRPVAVYKYYAGEFDAVGQLQVPPTILDDVPAALAWAGAHGDGVIVSFFRGGVLHLPEQPIYLGHADTHRAALWSSAIVIATEGAVLQRRF